MGNYTATAAGQTGATAKAEQASVHLKGGVSRERINIQMVQNVLLIWLDNNIDDNSADCRNTVSQLRRAMNTINTFTDGEECIRFLKDMVDDKACMIISGALGQHIVPRLHNMSQVDSIFIFCGNKKYHEQWAKEWSKIKGVFIEIAPICEALKQAAQQCEQNAISISFMATGDDASKKNLDQLDQSFMYSQILKEILLTIKFDEGHIMEFAQHCRTALVENPGELMNMNKLQQKYRDETPIWWYTYECFLYPMLNRALRLMDVDLIIKMGFFIGDLHRQIEQLHKDQFSGPKSGNNLTAYRGQGMAKVDFEKMMNTKGGLLSFNCFLSTSKNRNVSLDFSQSAARNPDLVGVLFIMTIDPSVSTTPFASVTNVGCYKDKEEEVLFSMHTVFRIGKITPMGENKRLFQVNLTLTSDNDKDLRVLTDRIREETFPHEQGWQRLGLLLSKMGQSEKAHQVFERLLGQTTDEGDKANTYERLGNAKRKQGEYKEAIKLYEKALDIRQKTLPPNHLNLGYSYTNIGNVYRNMGDYPKALSSHEKALAIRQQSLSPNHPDLAASYNNIGLVYYDMGDYPQALSSHEKALEIKQQSLPPNHPDLAASYNNIGLVYDGMGDYPKALSSHEKALEIKQQSLPPNHPDLGMSYNNIGLVRYNMGDYPKALSSHEKALEIRQQSLPPNHSDLAASYNNIGAVYKDMGDYPKALSSHEKTLAIQKQSLPANHPSLGMSYNNIGNVHYSMSVYPKALLYYEKSLEIRQQSLPPNHPDLAHSYISHGLVYNEMKEYSNAISCYEKALEIQKQSLPPDHPDLGMSYNNIGNVHYSMSDYPKALSYYEKALEIKQQSLPSNHPDLGYSYNNIGLVYENMGNNSKACSYYERAVNIGQQSLPSNHPKLQKWRKNLDRMKKKL